MWRLRAFSGVSEGGGAASKAAKSDGASTKETEDPESEEDAAVTKAWAAHKSDNGQVGNYFFASVHRLARRHGLIVLAPWQLQVPRQMCNNSKAGFAWSMNL